MTRLDSPYCKCDHLRDEHDDNGECAIEECTCCMWQSVSGDSAESGE
jgi:hypothetical protein